MPTLTAFDDMNPQPRVRIVFDEAEFDVAAVTATVLQISSDGEREVRDGTRVDVAGGVLVTDYEVPPGVTVTYQARQYDINGAVIGLTGSASASVSLEAGWVVVSDPLAPRRAVKLRALEGFAGSLEQSRPVELYQAGTNVVALMGPLSLFQSVNLRVLTETQQEVDALRAIAAAGCVLVRSVPPIQLPRCLYVVLPSIPRVPILAGVRSEWPLVGHEVTRPPIHVLEPVFTYGYYKAALAALEVETYGDSKALWTTYLDSRLNPPPEA